MSRVILPQPPKSDHDVSGTTAYGEVECLLPKDVPAVGDDQFTRALDDALARLDFDPSSDYVCLTGVLPVCTAVLTRLIAQHGEVMTLVYNSRSRRYDMVTYPLSSPTTAVGVAKSGKPIKLSPDVSRAAAMASDAATLQLSARMKLASLRERVMHGGLSDEDIVDSAFCVREAGRAADDVRKACDQFINLCGNGLGFRMAQAFIMNPDAAVSTRVQGKLATGDVKAKVSPSLPKAGTPEFVELARALGIPDDAMSVIRFNWDRVSEMCTRLVDSGQPLPGGIDVHKTHTIYALSTRRRVGVSFSITGASKDMSNGEEAGSVEVEFEEQWRDSEEEV